MVSRWQSEAINNK